MLRIHLSAADLELVRVAAQPDELWNLVLGVQLLQDAAGTPALDGWRSWAGRRVAAEPGARELVFRLAGLLPPRGYCPDFLTPTRGERALAAGIQAVLDTPRARVEAELGLLGSTVDTSVSELAGSLLRFHRLTVAPVTRWLRESFEVERMLKARIRRERGPGGLLASLQPFAQWRPPVLEVAYPVDQELALDGRGLVLIPSAFCVRAPMSLRDPELPPVLVYPAPTTWPAPRGVTDARALAALIGATRQRVLRCVVEADGGRTTSEIARTLDISLASASQHVTVLRAAGLVFSRRMSGSVLHGRTELGRALITAGD